MATKTGAGTPAQTRGVADEAKEFLSGKLAHVDVAGIEKELKQLWKSAASDTTGKPGGLLTRACSYTIVLVSHDGDAETTCNDLLDEVLVHRPGRGILAINRPERPHQLEAWVSARCHLEGSNRQICAEQITVRCEGGKAKELSSVVLPLVIADLPVFLYWRGVILEPDVFDALATCSNRFVIDSIREPFNLMQLRQFNDLLRARRGCLIPSDLNWRRLSGWMRAIADAFDGFPMPAEYLYSCSKITIGSVASSGPSKDFKTCSAEVASTQGVLLTAWLASRLGWQLVAPLNSAGESRFQDKSGNTVVVMFCGGQGQDVGHIVNVDCEFRDGKTLTVSSQKTDDLSYVVAQAKDSGQKEATRADYDLSEAALLAQEIGNVGPDAVYEAALAMATLVVGSSE